MSASDDSVCVDASFAIKLLVDESDSAEAMVQWETWVKNGTMIYAPRLFVWECANAVRRAVVQDRLPATEAVDALQRLTGIDVDLVNVEDDVVRVYRSFVAKYDMPAVYDATYLAVADMLGCELWTADKRLYRTVGHALPWVVPFGFED